MISLLWKIIRSMPEHAATGMLVKVWTSFRRQMLAVYLEKPAPRNVVFAAIRCRVF